MIAGLAGVAGHGVAVDAHQPLGLADAAALGDVLQDGDGLLASQMGMEQRGPLAFGEAIAARAAPEEADRVILAVMAADGEVFSAPESMIGALGIQAAEAREVIHGPPPTIYRGPRASSCDSASG
jgi:hypothetical protein